MFLDIGKAGLNLKFVKCEFVKPEVQLLGNKVEKNKFHVEKEKTKAIKESPVPRDTTELRGFLGIVDN